VILADTSVWVDHLRRGEPALAALLLKSQTLTHPFVLGELALGSLKRRQSILGALANLPRTAVAMDEEVLHAIDGWKLFDAGIGYVDAHLLTAVALVPGTLLWTRDKRLRTVAERLGLHAAVS
jgi:predicted nucleic acid-binding protein